jgi:hypothetical protein
MRLKTILPMVIFAVVACSTGVNILTLVMILSLILVQISTFEEGEKDMAERYEAAIKAEVENMEKLIKPEDS